ncbi:hypothetical protein [Peptacetobacter hiranonis]|uniref:Cell shape-determining protein n=1 Tax=Peptacetobacter hiranonis (strain DSM 13275 / JCM 10541 / KCTC 15199 / TO-931) TaxID=500633 RepID=B6FZT1_PEPHT|nr:hypothetical protein [Peptacetobacter hiranonis]EEA85025.1 hypothetical protein CLOHIR_01385 [Peptacetobacter hiranonis DSM 13275]QEK20835.1 hypothetical protein KGNDJEFE_01322 [Peptacetobacter hiranonis]
MKNFKSYAISFIITAVYAFVKLPVLRVDFTSLYYVLAMFFVIAGILNMVFDREEQRFTITNKTNFKIAIGILAIAVVLPTLASTPIIRAKAYRNLLGTVKESEFTKDVSPVNVNEIRIVDEEMAMKLGDKKLGEVPAIGSVSKLGKFHIQKVGEKLYWVAPLVHRDFIKWVTNMSGTNGYVMVSANDPQDVKLVQKANGEDIKIVYQPDAYILQDLHRHVYINGGMSKGMADYTLEIDDNGKPYWVVSLYEHKVGFGGANVNGTAIVDAKTGETKFYSIKDTPEWVDRIQPESFVVDQINSWGVYVNGFINSVISEKGVLKATEGTSLVYGEDNKSYWYTGITSAGGDESTIGFMLVDSRTKEAKLYKQPGATEMAAMKSAEGSVQEKNYEATFPVMYNILGQPTYVSSLKDKAGLVKRIVFVSVEDYNIVGVGRDKAEAMKNYKDALESGGSSLEIDESDEFDKELEGTVKRIAADTKNGNTVYYLTLDTDEGNIFYATSKISKELPLTKEGDKIKITFSKDEKDVIEIDEFDNYNIGKPAEQKEEAKPEDKKSEDKKSEENKSEKKETKDKRTTDKVETKEQ